MSGQTVHKSENEIPNEFGKASGKEILERRVRLGRLYDLYGSLLTERQRRIYELHELDDLSLSEISDELGISRQGVSDQLSTARDRLDELEKTLGFGATLAAIQSCAERVLNGGSASENAEAIIALCSGADEAD